jgi:hypothetical protein
MQESSTARTFKPPLAAIVTPSACSFMAATFTAVPSRRALEITVIPLAIALTAHRGPITPFIPIIATAELIATVTARAWESTFLAASAHLSAAIAAIDSPMAAPTHVVAIQIVAIQVVAIRPILRALVIFTSADPVTRSIVLAITILAVGSFHSVCTIVLAALFTLAALARQIFTPATVSRTTIVLPHLRRGRAIRATLLTCRRDRGHAKAHEQHQHRGPVSHRVHCKVPSVNVGPSLPGHPMRPCCIVRRHHLHGAGPRMHVRRVAGWCTPPSLDGPLNHAGPGPHHLLSVQRARGTAIADTR